MLHISRAILDKMWISRILHSWQLTCYDKDTFRTHFPAYLSGNSLQMVKHTSLASLISRLADVHTELQTLPPLPAVDKVKLQQERDIEHLYHSSKLEGTTLTRQRLENAIHGASI